MQKDRVFLWDNLRFFLITLVVIGHFLSQYMQSWMFGGLWLFIYAFHMPLFIFVSGAFHKNTKITHKVVSYMAMYVIYTLVVYITRLLLGQTVQLDLFAASGAPWYMLAMAVFVLLTYLLRNQNLKYVLVISVIVACFAGYDQNINYMFSLSRIIVFYPFYVMGVLSNKDTLLNLAKKPAIKAAAFGVVVAWLVLCIVFRKPWWPLNNLFAAENPFDPPFETWGCLWRLLCMGIATLLCFACILAAPTKRIPVISTVGTRTLQIYFWHRPLLYFIRYYGWVTLLCATTTGKCIYVLSAVVLTFLLALKPFSFPTSQIMKYRPPKTTKDK